MAVKKKRKATPAQLRALAKGRKTLAARRRKNPVKKKAVRKTPARKTTARKKNPATRQVSRRVGGRVLSTGPQVKRNPAKRKKNPARMYMGVALIMNGNGKGLYYFTGGGFSNGRRDAALFHTEKQAQAIMRGHLKKIPVARLKNYKFGTAHTDETRDAIIASLV